MSSEQAPKRFFGSEVEYPYTVKKGQNPAQPSNLSANKVRNLGGFLENGARHYIDAHYHPEYATGEIDNLDDLVAHELAGEEIVAVGQLLDPNSPIAAMYKRCISPGLNFTDGTHENYSTELNIWSNDKAEYLRYALGTHFATRSIYIGSGVATPQGKYWIAQKMQGIEEAEGKNSLEKKALVNLRFEPHAGGDTTINRLHVVCGDANISPFALRLKFGTTSLMLRLLEHGIDVSDLLLQEPKASAHHVGKNVSNMTTPLLLQNGQKMSALDIQEALAHRAFALSCRVELPEDEKQILYEWLGVIDALRAYHNTGDIDPILNQLDWYVKSEMIDRAMEHEKTIPPARVDFAYHKLLKGLGVKLRKSDEYFAPYMPSAKRIQQAKAVPPPGRATMRGDFIRHALDNQRPNNNTTELQAGWDYLSFIKDTVSRRIPLPLDGDYSKETIKTVLKEIF